MMADDESGALGGLAAVGAAAEWQRGLDAAIEQANKALQEAAARRGSTGIHHLQGFLAENWHAETFNIDAYKKGLWDLVAKVPSSTERASPDVVVNGGGAKGEAILEAQLKYYKDANATAAQLRNPEYNSVAKVVPADQLDGVKEASQRTVLREAEKRPHVAKAAQDTVDRASDRISTGGAESRPLERDESTDVAKHAGSGENVHHGSDYLSMCEIGEKALMGGAVAAGVGFAIGAAPALFEAIRRWLKDEDLSKDELLELLKTGGKGGARIGAQAGLQGAIGTALTHLAATGRLGDLVGQAGPGPIGLLSVVVVQGLRDGLAWHAGEMSQSEFARRTLTTAVSGAFGLKGAVLGQALIPVPFLGALIGSTVGSLVGRFGIGALDLAAEALVPALKDAVATMGEVLFAWDLAEKAREQTRELDGLFDTLDESIMSARVHVEGFALLRLPPIEPGMIEADTARQEARLDALERAWRSSQGE